MYKFNLIKIMCSVGLHKWKYEGYHLDKSKPNTWTENKRCCEICGKKQEMYFDIYDGRYWESY